MSALRTPEQEAERNRRRKARYRSDPAWRLKEVNRARRNAGLAEIASLSQMERQRVPCNTNPSAGGSGATEMGRAQ